MIREYTHKDASAENGADGVSLRHTEPPAHLIQEWLTTQLSLQFALNRSEIDPHLPFTDYGISSTYAISLSGDLENWLGRKLPPTLLWDYPSIAELSNYLGGGLRAEIEDRTTSLLGEPIAVIGLGCRFPGAASPSAFWQLLRNGTDAIGEVPADRWNASAFYDAQRAPGKMNTRWGGFLEQVDLFDAQFFNIAPREAVWIDPQQRLVLEVGWEALEHAGYAPDSLGNSRTGVFIGVSSSDYLQLGLADVTNLSLYMGTGNAHSIVANRLSYLLDLRGPSIAVDTACSSSLVAVHLACQSLRLGECNLALAGGVNVILTPELTVAFAQAGALAANGRCKTFDAGADGYTRSEGCGIVVLKRLSDALANGDTVLAVLRGSAINQDGASNGLTAPNGQAQQEVIHDALRSAGITPAQVSYVETHGTGTPLGDPIEIEALKAVLMDGRAHDERCALGSVKTNIGHLESAAGIAGLIKVVLSLHHQELYPHLHLETLNQLISFSSTPFWIPGELQPWSATKGERRIAGVSSFGFGGTNAHVLVEEAPPQVPVTNTIERFTHILTLSARSASALQSLTRAYRTTFAEQPSLAFADVCFTANVGRAHMPHRLAIVAETTAQASASLAAFLESKNVPGLYTGQGRRTAPPRVAFLFTGQGGFYPGVGQKLYETQPVFRNVVDQCSELLRPLLPESLAQAMYAQPEHSGVWETELYRQPALFVLEYALAILWQSWGIQPAAILGHSLGSYAAACVAGIFSLDDGLRLVAERGRLSSTLTEDSLMAVVFADADDVMKVLYPFSGQVVIAAFNGPGNTVISGKRGAVQEVIRRFEASGVTTHQLSLAMASHSPFVEPILAPFEQAASKVRFSAPTIPYVSDLTAQFLEEAPNAQYWRQHLRRSIKFADALCNLADYPIFLEVGPSTSLLRIGKRVLPSADIRWLPSLQRHTDDEQVILNTLGDLYAQGIPVDWRGFDLHYRRSRLVLPTYPFERQRYWIGHAREEVPVQPDRHSPGSMTNESRFPSTIHISSGGPAMPLSPNHTRKDTILRTLQAIVARLLGLDAALLDPLASFLEMGADSLVLIQVLQTIRSTFQIDLTIGQLFDGIHTLNALADYIDRTAAPNLSLPSAELPQGDMPASSLPALPSMPQASIEPMVATAAADSSTGQVITHLLNVHAQVMTSALETLRRQSEAAPIAVRMPALSAPEQARPEPSPPPKRVQHSSEEKNAVAEAFVPFQPAHPEDEAELTPRQQRHLQELIARYTQRTARSKQQVATDRVVHADLRNSLNFRMATKEMCYPLVVNRSAGSKIYDVDGNEYIDLTMGFGVNFFGHNEPFINAAINEQIDRGIQLGPQPELAGAFAQLICECSGMERAAFCNTGSEAVMIALRLARTVTGRPKIALFAGSYHGSADPILVAAQVVDGNVQTAPMAPGILKSIADEVSILTYGSAAALEQLRAQRHELAAVLVEPVQSRRPDLQPGAFLQEVRQITEEAGVALIFDEMITGFRTQLGGAQAYFGVRADIATYGKVLGGGLPIGVIAGKAAYMDAIDGGAWNFGDQSFPAAKTTFFSGTFCKHPFALAAGYAVLARMKQEGPALQEKLNLRVARFAHHLNSYFAQEGLPIKVASFGSLFRFSFSLQMTFSDHMNLLFYHLLEKGVYIWEGRNCFLSTAHTDDDIERVIQAVKESVAEMRAGGFLPERAPEPEGPGGRFKQEQQVQAFPLSEAQQQSWMLSQMGSAGSETIALELRGELHIAALQESLQEIVARHEALRTTIDAAGDQQYIAPESVVELPLIDCSHPDPSASALLVTRWLQEESSRPFNLTDGPLMRCHLLRRSDQWHTLVIAVHHIVIDGWSIGVIFQELGALYSAACADALSQLAPPMQFSAYLRQQQQADEGDRMATLEAYWLRKCAGPMPLLDLPGDHPRPPVRSYRGERQSKVYDATLCRRLKALSRKQNCTLFMSLITGYLVLLHRLSEQRDLCIGFPTSGRSTADSERMIGYCSHLVPLRSQVPTNLTLEQYLAYIRLALLEAYEHQDYPYARLLNKLNLPRDPGRSPLVSATFNMEPPITVPRLASLQVEFTMPPVTHSEFDVHLNIAEIDGTLLATVDYNLDLFDTYTMQQFLQRYEVVLTALLDNPEQGLWAFDLLTLEERQELAAWNHTKVAMQPDFFPTLFAKQAGRTPDAIALAVHDTYLSYEELERRANQLARYLSGLGVGADNVIGLCLEHTLALVIGLLGVLKTGAAFVMLDPAYPRERLAFMLADSQAPVLITQEYLRKHLDSATTHIVCLDADWPRIAQQSVAALSLSLRADQLAYVIYTSGSTGTPKGVMLTHGGLSNYLLWCQQAYPVEDGWGALVHSPISADLTITSLFLPLLCGETVALVPEHVHTYEIETVLRERAGSSFFKVTPAHLTLFAQLLSEEKFAHVTRSLIVGGEQLLGEQLAPWRASAPETRLFNEYGPTETVVGCCVYEVPPGQQQSGAIPIGQPIANTQLYVLDRAFCQVPVGAVGELYIGGAGLARGYLNRPDLTAERFIPNPFVHDERLSQNGAGPAQGGERLYRTGDLVRYVGAQRESSHAGVLTFLGRADHQIKIRGFRVEPGEIEAVLCQHPQVQEAVVLVPDKKPGEVRLIAYIIPVQPVPQLSELRSFLLQRLPEHMVPTNIVMLEAFPLTASGKIDRHALAALDYSQSAIQPESYVAPRTTIEQQLVAIWEQVLGMHRIGIYDNFFQLGGNSLLATQVITRLPDDLRVEAPLRSMFVAPTVASFAELVMDRHTVPGQASKNIIQRAVRGNKQASQLLTAIRRGTGELEHVGD